MTARGDIPGTMQVEAHVESTNSSLSTVETSPVERIRQAVRQAPAKMTMQLARDLGVPEVEVIRALPDNRAVELDIGRGEDLLRRLEALGEVHVIVSNGAATLESVGQFGGFSTWGEFFNVQTKTLDMHLRFGQLGVVFAVEKPSHMSGVNTLSFQFYDREGHAALKVFLNFGGQIEAERAAQFVQIRDDFRKP
jgi:putative heme iron utilization protein